MAPSRLVTRAGGQEEEAWGVLGQEKLGGSKPAQLGGYIDGGQLGDIELSGTDIGVGDPGFAFVLDDRDEVVVGLRIEEVGFYDRARGNDPDYFTINQALGQGGLADLVADRYFVTPVDQFGQVVVQGMMRDAGHGVALAPAHLSGR